MAAKKTKGLAQTVREDGWINTVSGIGTTRDKTVAGFYCPEITVSDIELEALYYHEDLAAKIVDKRPDEAFRKGYRLEGEGVEDLADLQEDAEEHLNLDTHIQNAWRWARLFGSALVIMGINDGQAMDQPVNEKAIKGVDFLNVIDRRFVRVASYYADPLAKHYGDPDMYEIFQLSDSLPSSQVQAAGLTGLARVHASRVLRFDGVITDRRKSRQLAGWSYSVLQRVYNTLRGFGTSFQAAALLLNEASQGVFKIEGLISMIAGNQKGALLERMALVDQSKSIARSILLDSATEDYTRVATSFGGIPETLDRFIQRMAAAADMPVTVLMGISPAGLNATGQSDMRLWYDSIAADQDKTLTCKLLTLYRYLAIADGFTPEEIESLKISWLPLYEMSEQEEADIYQKTASADKTYFDIGAIQPEEIAIARWGQGKFSASAPIAVNVEELNKQLTAVDFEVQNEGLLTPSDLSTAVTVNEARASKGLAPLTLPNGKPDPDGGLTVAEFKAKREAKGSEIGTAQGSTTTNAPPNAGNAPANPASGKPV